MDLNGKRIAILATDGFEQSELEVPRDRLIKAGATVDVVSLAGGEIKGWDCPSSYDLRQIVPVRKGGSGSLVEEVMRPAADAASGDWRLFGV